MNNTLKYIYIFYCTVATLLIVCNYFFLRYSYPMDFAKYALPMLVPSLALSLFTIVYTGEHEKKATTAFLRHFTLYFALNTFGLANIINMQNFNTTPLVPVKGIVKSRSHARGQFSVVIKSGNYRYDVPLKNENYRTVHKGDEILLLAKKGIFGALYNITVLYIDKR